MIRISSSWSVSYGRITRVVCARERNAARRAYWRRMKQECKRRAA